MSAKDYRPTTTYGGHDRHDRAHAARQPAVDPHKEDLKDANIGVAA